MTATASSTNVSRRYEIGVLLLLTLVNGVVAFDRLTVAYLSPYIVTDMGLSNAQLGLLAGALSGAIALSSFFGGRLADKTGRRKLILVICTLLFSLGSGAGGLAMTFTVLFAARFALGVAEGPMVPISQTVIADTAAPERRGISMGFMQMVGAFGIAGFLGPIVATQLADIYGWRTTLLLSILPGLLLMVLLMVFLKPDTTPSAQQQASESPVNTWQALGELLSIGNIRVSLAIAAMITAWLVLQNTFLAVYLTQDMGLSATMTGQVISMGGVAGIIGGIGLPFLSDRVGRRPVMIGASLAAAFCPIALLTLPADPVLLGGAILLGWLPLGMAPLYCATVPSESVSPALATTAIGLAMGTAELFGGVIVPPIAGMIADSMGLSAVFYICIAFAIIAAAIATQLVETAPCKTQQ